MWQPGRTAEEMLEELQAELESMMETEDILRGLYQRASERDQIRMMGHLDQGREAGRLLGALGVARGYLDRPTPPEPDAPPPSKRRV